MSYVLPLYSRYKADSLSLQEVRQSLKDLRDNIDSDLQAGRISQKQYWALYVYIKTADDAITKLENKEKSAAFQARVAALGPGSKDSTVSGWCIDVEHQIDAAQKYSAAWSIEKGDGLYRYYLLKNQGGVPGDLPYTPFKPEDGGPVYPLPKPTTPSGPVLGFPLDVSAPPISVGGYIPFDPSPIGGGDGHVGDPGWRPIDDGPGTDGSGSGSGTKDGAERPGAGASLTHTDFKFQDHGDDGSTSTWEEDPHQDFVSDDGGELGDNPGQFLDINPWAGPSGFADHIAEDDEDPLRGIVDFGSILGWTQPGPEPGGENPDDTPGSAHFLDTATAKYGFLDGYYPSPPGEEPITPGEVTFVSTDKS